MKNNRGYILATVLVAFLLFNSIIFLYTTIVQLNIRAKHYDIVLKERIKLEKEIVNYIVEQLYNYQEEDCNYEEYDSNISITYNDITATIVVDGKHNFVAELVYDDIDNIVQAYRYK